MRKRTTLTLAAVAFVLVASAALPGTAQAASFTGFASWYDSTDLKGAFGLGIRGSFPLNENWEFDVTGSYQEDFNNAFPGAVDVEVGVIPIDFGVTWNRDGQDGGFNAGVGVTWGLMDVGGLEIQNLDIPRQGADADDEWGGYAKLGWRNPNGFMIEVLYRALDVSIENIDPAAEFPRNRVDLDMDGFVFNVGYRF